MLSKGKTSLLVFTYSCATLHALTDLETSKRAIVSVLHQEKNPACVKEFTTFFERYNTLVTSFFDTKNKEPLETHIKRMEKELQVLHKVCSDSRYRSIHHILLEYPTHLSELITVLKKFIGSRSTLKLAWKVRKFKSILPTSLQNTSDPDLYFALDHRLKCG